MKTLEFKTRLNQFRLATVEQWLEGCRCIWNMALEILEENQQWFWREKSGITDDPHPVPWRWTINEIDGERVFALCCDTTVGRDYRMACPIKRTPGDRAPKIVCTAKDLYKTLTGIFAAKNHSDKPWMQAIPSEVIRGTLRSLSDAWKEYRGGKRQRPRFKSKHKPLKSLSCNIPVKIEGDHVWFPKLGWLTCKTLAERWEPEVTPKVIKLVKRPSGWYVQLTGNLPLNWVAKPSEIACGLDVGLEFLVADDAGKTVNPPRYYRAAEKRLRRLQRKWARQERGSAKANRTKQLIARLHERIADQRSRFNHKISTYIVRNFGGVAVENISISNLNRRPKPKLREDGKGWERNNAAAKSGLNKSFADAGIGQLLTMTEQKAATHEREYIKVAPHYTSQDCPQCGHRQKKSLSQRTHRCSNCGYTTGRDHAAAENIKAKADFKRSYRSSVRNVKPVEPVIAQAMKRERVPTRLDSDAVTLHQLSLNLDVPIDNDSSHSTDELSTQKPTKSSNPRKRRMKDRQNKPLDEQGQLPLWEVG